MGVLGDLLGLTSGATPGGDVLGALRASQQQNLNDQISQLNASSPGRFSTANLYQQGLLRERSMNDFNTLAANVLEHGRDRQLQAIMALLGPVLGPTFGGPFTQGSSLWENLLGGAQAAAGLASGGGLGGLFGGGQIKGGKDTSFTPTPAIGGSSGWNGRLWP